MTTKCWQKVACRSQRRRLPIIVWWQQNAGRRLRVGLYVEGYQLSGRGVVGDGLVSGSLHPAALSHSIPVGEMVNTNNLTLWFSWFSLFNYNSSCKPMIQMEWWNDGHGLVADSAGLGRHVFLAWWFDCKWASEREKISRDSKGETIRGVPENPNSLSLTNRRGTRRYPHKLNYSIIWTHIT